MDRLCIARGIFRLGVRGSPRARELKADRITVDEGSVKQERRARPWMKLN